MWCCIITLYIFEVDEFVKNIHVRKSGGLSKTEKKLHVAYEIKKFEPVIYTI